MGEDNLGLTRPHCVVADDEAHLRRVLVRLMESEGFSCHEAANGRIALEVLDRVPATVLLSDLHMPELDGLGLLAEVRARFPDTAVIMITVALLIVFDRTRYINHVVFNILSAFGGNPAPALGTVQ